MNKQKVSILALLVAFALCMTAMWISLMSVMRAGAEATISNSSIFTTSGTAGRVDGDYLSYNLDGADDTVTFRKNLALKWFTFADEEKTVGGAKQAQYFTLTISLENTRFESFTVALETTQMSMSKEGKTVNEVVFTPDGSNVKATVNGEEASAQSVVATEDITIALTETDDQVGTGNFTVTINGTEAGTFTNIGKYYAQYASSSADTPITPLTFKFESENPLTFNIKSMNGQSFALDSDDKIKDDVAPVLVINSEIKQFVLGEELNFDYVTMDVCSSSITTKRYYLVEGIPAKDEDDKEITAEFNEEGELVGYNDLDTSKRFFEDDFGGNVQGGNFSVAFELTDGNSNTGYYFIEWYGSSDTLTMVNPSSVDSRPTVGFMEFDEASNAWKETAGVAEYGDAVSAASVKDGKSIQVGSGAYYYVPSLKAYISDATCGYTDMSFTIYYKTNGSDTQTVTGDYDDLRIPVNTEGDYAFRVVPTNNAGNGMVGSFERGTEYYEDEITSSNVWDAKNLVTFRFSVTYDGAYIEEPEEEEVGYVDVTYSVGSFEIIALSGYKTEYGLYRFVANDGNAELSVAEVKAAEQADGTNTLGTWVKINEYDSELEDEENDNAYQWNPGSSLSFVPQEMGFYKVQVTVDDQSGKTQTDALPTAYKIINVTAEADVIPGATYWLQNNILSVVFLGIGVLCLIAIVILLVVKPKDKAVLEAEKARKEELKEKRENRK